MFRPNRIGTPVIHTDDYNTAAGAFTPVGSSFASNAMNALPVGDFGRSALLWNGTPIAAPSVWGLAQQFTVQAPLNGDTVGFELNFALEGEFPANAQFVPFVFQATSAAGGTLQPLAAYQGVTLLEPAVNGQPLASTGTIYRHTGYQTQVIQKRQLPAGTYGHGLRVFGNGSWNIGYFFAVASIRQLNDQQFVGYRDTLR